MKEIRSIADIAKMAGVSKSTVSRALANSTLIKDETRKRIQKLAQEYDFVINQGARNLSMQKTNTVAFIVPLNISDDYIMVDPYIQILIGSFIYNLSQKGYDLLIAQKDPEDSRWINKYFNSKKVDGVILFPYSGIKSEIEMLAKMKAPFIVTLNHSKNSTYCSVSTDDYEGGKMATEHLLKIGCKKLGFIGGWEHEAEIELRYKGYYDTLMKANILIDKNKIQYADYTSESAYDAMNIILKQAPDIDGVFVSSDVMAKGAMDAIHEKKLRIPEDIAVVGYDNVPLAEYCNPPLTTIKQDITKIARVTVRNLLQYIEDRIITTTVIPAELIVRQSTMK